MDRLSFPEPLHEEVKTNLNAALALLELAETEQASYQASHSIIISRVHGLVLEAVNKLDSTNAESVRST